MTLLKSWIASANNATHPFPLNNLPYGVFATEGAEPRCGVAIGDMIFDITSAEAEGLINLIDEPLFDLPFWNPLMEQGPAVWAALRARLTSLLAAGSEEQDRVEPLLVAQSNAVLHMPFAVSEYTDFYAGRHHAQNVGTMFRGSENALPPNWLHIPIGYNGRASSVVVSGTDVRRPWGQLKSPDHDRPAFLPSRRFDIELEMGAIVGTPSDGPISVQEADDNIFGYVLLNDWSARDIQAWEYQPLGPFQAKATATSISPWIVTKAALEPFRCDTPAREHELLDHLKDCGPMLYDIDLSITMAPSGKPASTIARTNYREMYYSAAQQLAHHTTSGCPMNTGDLLGSGTISGPTKPERGSLLELSWGGKEPLTLDTGETRSFIEDGDTMTLTGAAKGDGYSIGFGNCVGTVLPALENPFAR
ncbi:MULTISPECIES: fumarylacetoacetase [unclassified Ruegeria]|uniref:fumarylacetoacetase n=1 Tax=unclassified Ruegeria TaxID=2625375 RepID=UPI001ADB7A76|nr:MULTISPECIES: fumarylacetoacetase [unclassified Ruegeria]MBO9410856.1 fumarylacetoacetase [Ruegeria sp. R8_1]MBO9415057.1 fumarylacetoacetase [Ruegeria sp. R8_2]